MSDAVVKVNLSRHQRLASCQQIEENGASVRFLPPYSPDLNLIERINSKIKRRLRPLGCCSLEARCEAMPSALDTLTPGDAIHCIRH